MISCHITLRNLHLPTSKPTDLSTLTPIFSSFSLVARGSVPFFPIERAIQTLLSPLLLYLGPSSCVSHLNYSPNLTIPFPLLPNSQQPSPHSDKSNHFQNMSHWIIETSLIISLKINPNSLPSFPKSWDPKIPTLPYHSPYDHCAPTIFILLPATHKLFCDSGPFILCSHVQGSLIPIITWLAIL